MTISKLVKKIFCFQNFKNFNFDKLVFISSLTYVILPIIIFFFGWLKLPIAIFSSMFFLLLGISVYKNNRIQLNNKFILDNKYKSYNLLLFWILVLVIMGVWVYFSGIGNFATQFFDFATRNPTFRDLSTKDWPIIYDLSKQSEIVREICGDGKVAFLYYFCWWLPVALVSKVFCLSENVRNVLLYMWALTGLMNTIFLLLRKLNKLTLVVPIIFILFTGLDIVGRLILTEEIWIENFEYSSNTTMLFNVFNQCIPIWLIISMLFQLNDSKFVIAIGSLGFAYSPWAMIGLIPYIIAIIVKDKKSLIDAINIKNIMVPIIMLLIFGTFYSLSYVLNESLRSSFIQFEVLKHFKEYVLFIFLEFGIYFILISCDRKKFKFYWITLIELLVIPLFLKSVSYNFCCRTSIPPLFMLMLYIMQFILDDNVKDKFRHYSKNILIVVLCIAFVVPVIEIIGKCGGKEIFDPIYSFDDIKTDDRWIIEYMIKDQSFVYDYENTFFFKYLAKK